METITKQCTKCKEIKEISLYHKSARSKNGFSCICKECTKELSKIYRDKNKDKINKDKKTYRENNIEKVRKQKRESYKKNFEKISVKAKERYPLVKDERVKYLREYYSKNKEELLIKQKAYAEKHKENTKAYKKIWNKTETAILLHKKSKANRRAREKNQGIVTKSELRMLKSKSTKCYWCNCKIGKDYHFDHYVPLSKDGANTIDNLVVSCVSCNYTKKAKDPLVFANSIGRLL